MRARATLCVAAAIISAGVVGAQPPARSTSALPLLIADITVVDGTGAPPRPHTDVLVRDGVIAEIIPTASRRSDAALTVDGSGRVLIPGLFDAHVHLSGMPWEQRVPQLKRYLDEGITTVWDVAGDVRQTSDLSRAELAGEIESPAIEYAALMAGPPFFADPRVVASSLGFVAGQAPWAASITADTDVVRAVAAARGAGASAIKLYAALDASAVNRIAEEARRQKMRLVAHATVFPAKPSDLVAAGVNVLAHAAYLVWEGSPPTPDYTHRAKGDFAHVAPDSAPIERVLAAMRDRGVALNPTLWVFADGPGGRDEMKTERTRWMNTVTRRAAELGVTIAAGTDGMMEGRPVLHRELELEVAAGLTPMQAVLSATGGAAHAVGVDATRGTIERGKIADLVVLSRNPLDDIRNTRAIEVVVHRGRIVR